MNMGWSPAAASPADEITKAAFNDCVLVLQGRVHLDNAAEMSSSGYNLEPADNEGVWASRDITEGRVRIGVGPGKPGCRIRFSGSQSEAVYEAVLKSALQRGFVFPDGKRKPPEAAFVMDTLVQEKGPIGIVSMFRLRSPEATEFAMTLFPPISESK